MAQLLVFKLVRQDSLLWILNPNEMHPRQFVPLMEVPLMAKELLLNVPEMKLPEVQLDYHTVALEREASFFVTTATCLVT